MAPDARRQAELRRRIRMRTPPCRLRRWRLCPRARRAVLHRSPPRIGRVAGMYAARTAGCASEDPWSRSATRCCRTIRTHPGCHRPRPDAHPRGVGGLLDRIRRGEAVALVADRAIGGAGATGGAVRCPRRLPRVPRCWRSRPELRCTRSPSTAGRPASGPAAWSACRSPPRARRRERIRTATLEAAGRAFERFIAQAPEQWWTLLFRIWEEMAM